MDLNNLLSIMGRDSKNNKDLLNVLSMFNNKNTGENKNNADMLASLLNNGNPNIGSLMSLYGNQKPRGFGLKPISAFSSDEILGVLVKYFMYN